MDNTGAPLYLEYLEGSEGAPEIPWRINMDKINGILSTNGAIITRSQSAVYSSSLATDARDSTKFINLGLGGIIYKITTNHPAWVEIYDNEEHRVADLSRSIEVDPRSGAGVFAEVLTKEGVLEIPMSPPALYWNNEYPLTSDIPVTITNKDDEERVVLVVIDYLRIENAIS